MREKLSNRVIRVEPLVFHLRIDLAQKGDTLGALSLLQRISTHKRVYAAILESPLIVHLPYELRRFGGQDLKNEIDSAIDQLYSDGPDRLRIFIEILRANEGLIRIGQGGSLEDS